MGCCNVVAILSMADMVCLDCMQKLCSAWVVLGLWSFFFFLAEILLLLKHGRCWSSFMRKTGVSKAEYLVYSMCTNRLSACREFCVVHIQWNL